MDVINVRALNVYHQELIELLQATQHDDSQSTKLIEAASKSSLHSYAALTDLAIVKAISKDTKKIGQLVNNANHG